MLTMKGRYYRTIPLNNPGYETEEVELDPRRTALVGMHCWNIGCEDGPAIDLNYFVGMGSLESFREAERIMRECISTAMEVSRQAGVLVCHVESDLIAVKHSSAKVDVEAKTEEEPSPVVPGWRKKMEDRFHGQDYRENSPLARMDRAGIVAPLPQEPFVYQTEDLDHILRRKGVENLIYTGFAADMCVLRAPGGIELMAPKGYRVFLMRDATVGVECPDTFADRIATRWAIRYFETHYGDTIVLEDYLAACKRCV